MTSTFEPGWSKNAQQLELPLPDYNAARPGATPATPAPRAALPSDDYHAFRCRHCNLVAHVRFSDAIRHRWLVPRCHGSVMWLEGIRVTSK